MFANLLLVQHGNELLNQCGHFLGIAFLLNHLCHDTPTGGLGLIWRWRRPGATWNCVFV